MTVLQGLIWKICRDVKLATAVMQEAQASPLNFIVLYIVGVKGCQPPSVR